MDRLSAHHAPRWSLALVAAPLALVAASAVADGINVTISNDGTQDINVTVYDTTVRPRRVILSQRINGFSTVPLYMSPDASGRANLSWTAVTVDPHNRRCGHADQVGLADSAQVSVHADSDCAST